MTDRIQTVLDRVMRELQREAPSAAITRVVRKPATPPQPDNVFVIVSEDHSGLGWAKRLVEERVKVVYACRPPKTLDPKDRRAYDRVGQGWVPKLSLDEALRTLKSPHTYWIFAENHLTEVAESLRAAGQKVFGTSTLGERMEHDRAFAVRTAKQAGLETPDSHGFTTIAEGLKFLDAHPDTAYVFKPDDAASSHLTAVPIRERAKDANRELYHYLKHLDTPISSFLLQERKSGVEVNVEAWIFQGRPFFAFACLENKRKGVRNSGELVGCAGDIVFPVPLDAPLVQQTIGKLFPFYAKERYTGFADVNVLIGDNAVWFLEAGNRFGYNAHITLFFGLALDGFAAIMADIMDGKTDGMATRFRKGFGASISLGIDHPRPGIPLFVREDYATHFYPYDGYREDDTLLLAGWSSDVGVFVDFDYTLTGAAEAVFHRLYDQEAVSFSDMIFRDDLGQRDYPGSPIHRYEALVAMGLLR